MGLEPKVIETEEKQLGILDLIPIIEKAQHKYPAIIIDDFAYTLFRIGETPDDAIATCSDLDRVAEALCNHILYKTTADVNRGIYLHKEKGIEKYR